MVDIRPWVVKQADQLFNDDAVLLNATEHWFGVTPELPLG